MNKTSVSLVGIAFIMMFIGVVCLCLSNESGGQDILGFGAMTGLVTCTVNIVVMAWKMSSEKQ